MIAFIETSLFTKIIHHYLSDDEYVALQQFLMKTPDAGTVIQGTKGVRKLRWAAKGRGKRGGIRVIYYLKLRDGQIWLLTLYGKERKENIPAHILNKLREVIENG